MNFQDHLPDAIDVVLTCDLWDLPDEAFADAVRGQACLLAGMQPEEIAVLPFAAFLH